MMHGCSRDSRRSPQEADDHQADDAAEPDASRGDVDEVRRSSAPPGAPCSPCVRRTRTTRPRAQHRRNRTPTPTSEPIARVSCRRRRSTVARDPDRHGLVEQAEHDQQPAEQSHHRCRTGRIRQGSRPPDVADRGDTGHLDHRPDEQHRPSAADHAEYHGDFVMTAAVDGGEKDDQAGGERRPVQRTEQPDPLKQFAGVGRGRRLVQEVVDRTRAERRLSASRAGGSRADEYETCGTECHGGSDRDEHPGTRTAAVEIGRHVTDRIRCCHCNLVDRTGRRGRGRGRGRHRFRGRGDRRRGLTCG